MTTISNRELSAKGEWVVSQLAAIAIYEGVGAAKAVLAQALDDAAKARSLSGRPLPATAVISHQFSQLAN